MMGSDRKTAVAAAAEYCKGRGAQLEQLAPGAWLIWANPPTAGRSRLVGCVEVRGVEFELMEFGPLLHWSRFGSLVLAVTHLLMHAQNVVRAVDEACTDNVARDGYACAHTALSVYGR